MTKFKRPTIGGAKGEQWQQRRGEEGRGRGCDQSRLERCPTAETLATNHDADRTEKFGNRSMFARAAPLRGMRGQGNDAKALEVKQGHNTRGDS